MTPCWAEEALDVPETVQTEDVLAAQVLMTLAVPGAGPRAMTTTTTASGMAAWAVAVESAGAAAARRSLRRAHVGDALRRCAAAVEPVTVAEQGQTFTPLHDTWLLRAAERLGAAAAQRAAIKRASMSDGAFLFDHYFRSRTAEQLGERLDKLVEVAKRSRDIEQLADAPATAAPATAAPATAAPAPLSQRRITAAWTAKKPRATARVHELTQAEVGKLDAVLRERQAARDAEIERLTAQAAGQPRQSPGRAREYVDRSYSDEDIHKCPMCRAPNFYSRDACNVLRCFNCRHRFCVRCGRALAEGQAVHAACGVYE